MNVVHPRPVRISPARKSHSNLLLPKLINNEASVRENMIPSKRNRKASRPRVLLLPFHTPTIFPSLEYTAISSSSKRSLKGDEKASLSMIISKRKTRVALSAAKRLLAPLAYYTPPASSKRHQLKPLQYALSPLSFPSKPSSPFSLSPRTVDFKNRLRAITENKQPTGSGSRSSG